MERLQKFLAEAGIASRRKAEELILNGEVKVNGEIITSLGVKVDPDKDIVIYRGKLVEKPAGFVYYMINKPAGYVSAVSDDRGRESVVSLVPGKDRVYPVGRLDYNTTGLLLLTNDGELTYKLTHPSNEIEKEYFTWVKGILDEKEIQRLRTGIDIGDFVTSPAKVRVLDIKEGNMKLSIIIHEGKNRQVRRMVEAAGSTVIRLRRVAVGDLRIGELEEGCYRKLSKEEVEYLKRL
ncbi:MAG: rRNA pseudouridine synthase [Clostridiales bacterium]|jgi:23S rRNA pseudouridine2605 synthase|nr:rRNA pseudouridine synthase [Clostridiales bacterium]